MQDSYQALARKYRPQLFQDVIGQDAIIKTLKNALKSNRISHAYLFTGTRGVGKTTLARLFAKALNCKNLNENHEPCNQCQSCNDIASGRAFDVIEIDGASNRGIDDIRQINETVNYAPSLGNYKIYIIDEVHMLTKEAFNALLKTLEEPPETIKFFFATTEPHKVLPTILSRCQRFDLKNISQKDIQKTLINILNDFNREYDEEAIHLISEFADGSMRDAESLLDQLLCFEEGKITHHTVTDSLGILSHDLFFELDNAIHNQKIEFIFDLVHKIIDSGKDLGAFIEDLIEHFRFHLLVKLDKKQYLTCSKSRKEKYLNSSFSLKHLIQIFEVLMKTSSNISKSPHKKATVEMMLLEIFKMQNAIPLADIAKKLSLLAQTPQTEPINTSSQTPSPSLQTEITKEPNQPISEPLEETPQKPIPPQTNNPLLKHPQSHYDTLMRFAAVELEGTLKKQGE
ncbi:MAG TPA: DNA polymerase III subunit gamma/tau [Chlamydiales bacterium]|nr:DNA polymerase III subunit gamma/tau [Chlamydiales bacterium]